MKFKALIDGVHFDPKKGVVKIQLIATSHDVSLDEMTTIVPSDESVFVTFESEQTKIDAFSLAPNVGDLITFDKEAATKLKEAADRLEEVDEKEEIVTELPTEKAEDEIEGESKKG